MPRISRTSGSGRVLRSNRIPRVGRIARSGRQTDYESFIAHNPAVWDWLQTQSGFRVSWFAKDADALLMRATNPYVAEGRNILLDGDMEAATTAAYAAQNSATLTKSTASPHAGANALRITYNGVAAPAARQTIVVTGKAYRAVGWARGDGGGGVPRLLSSTAMWVGTNSTSWQAFDVTFIAGSANVDVGIQVGSAGSWVEFDDVTVKQVNIRASTDYPSATGRLNQNSNWEFNFDYAYTKGTGWTIAAGVASIATPGANSNLTQTTWVPVAGKSYDVTFTITSISAGTVTPLLGGATGTGRTTVGTFTETIVTSTNGAPSLRGSATCVASVDDWIVVPTDSLLVYNGDGSTTTGWTAGNNAVLSSVSGWQRVARNGTNNPQSAQANLIIGRRYRVTALVRGDGNGAAIPRLVNNAVAVAIGTNSTSTQVLDGVFIAGATSLVLQVASVAVDGHYCEFDDIVVKEINPLDGIISQAVLNSGRPAKLGGYSLTFDGVNDFVNIYSAELNSLYDPSKGWMGVGASVAVADWANAANTFIARLGITVNTQELRVADRSTAGRIESGYYSGTLQSVNWDGNASADFFLAGTGWQIGGIGFDGDFNGNTSTFVGAVAQMVGNLSTTLTAIGAGTPSGTNAFKGEVAFLVLFSEYPTNSMRLKASVLAGVVT